MPMTIGKNLDTNTNSLTFSSTGRIIKLTVEESEEFMDRMRIIKMQYKFELEAKNE